MAISKKYFLLLILLPWFLFSNNSNADIKEDNDFFIYKAGEKSEYLGNYIYYFADEKGIFNSENIISQRFKKLNVQIPNLQISNTSHWINFSIKNQGFENKIMLRLAQPFLDTVELYCLQNNKLKLLFVSGDLMKFADKEIKERDHIFPLYFSTGETRTFYMRIKSGEQVTLPISISSEPTEIKDVDTNDIIFGLYSGIMLVMFIYNFFVWFVVRDKSYLYYIFYIFSVYLTQASLEGYIGTYIFINSRWIANFMVYLSSVMVGITALTFVRNYLNTPENSPKLNKGLYIFIVFYIVTIFLATIGEHSVSYTLILMLAMTSAIYCLVTAIYLANKKIKAAVFFLYAWSFFIVCVICYVLKDAGVLGYNLFTVNSLKIGSAVEAIVLSFALADKIKEMEKERNESQLKMLVALQENERIVTEQNVELEKKVKERTRDLEQAQSQLVNAEKMASIGQLTAGIAHEINNPINFVSSNIIPLKRDVDDMVLLFNKYKEISTENVMQKLFEVEKLSKEIDVDILISEMNQLMKGIEEGAARTTEIVKGLRNFSRLDEAELKSADINEGIKNTLNLLSNLTKNNIEVFTDFGKLEPIECFPGKMNQVFMNILTNAIQAIKKKFNNGDKGLLKIITKQSKTDTIIIISDNGNGIPEEILSKIFDPFFTTKDVGEGTGLGLSIVYSIIENHFGEIKVDSKLNEGTTFTIKIPMNLIDRL